jgi:hypothetical protein
MYKTKEQVKKKKNDQRYPGQDMDSHIWDHSSLKCRPKIQHQRASLLEDRTWFSFYEVFGI